MGKSTVYGATPKDSIIFNRFVSLYEEYTFFMWWLVAVVCALVSLILLLVTSLTKLRKTTSALRKREDELVASEQSLQGILFASPIGIGRTRERIFEWVNESMCRITGYSIDEIQHKNTRFLFQNDEEYQRVGRLLYEQGWIETKWVRKDGAVRHILIQLSQTSSYAYVFTASDITDLKQTEEYLRRLSIAIEQAAEDIIITDPEGVIQYVNPAFEKITGYSRQEAIGRTTGFLKSGVHDTAFYENLWKTIKGGVVWTGRITNKRKDGVLIEEDATISPLLNSSGEITGFVSLKRDVTEQVRLESQLRQAQKVEVIGQLAGGVAHDFNNILSTIMGHASLLQMKMGNEDPLKSHVEQILLSSEKAANLTQSLLAFSRKQVIHPKPINLNETVAKMEKLLSRLITEDVELKTEFSEDKLVIMADSSQIDQVLMNLVTNARDAMPRGGAITIKTGMVSIDNDFVRTHGYGHAGKYAVLSVSDTGIGMDEKTKEKIFEPFFTTKEAGKGTGLGLSIVYGIIKQHNGYVSVLSAPGRGTTFLLYLPLVKGTTKEMKEETKAAPRGGETILIAEDSPDLRVLVRIILEEHGYAVIEAEDGLDATEKFLADTVDLVILDVVMPKMNGKEAYDAIRKMSPDVQVLFVSGYTDDVISEKGIREEGLSLISKPIVPNELLIKIRELLDGKKNT